MKLFYLFIISIIAMLFISGIATAFTEDFESLTFNAWNGRFGTMSIQNGDTLNHTSHWAKIGGVSSLIKTIDEPVIYWQFEANMSQTATNAFELRWRNQSSANQCAFLLGTGNTISAQNVGTCADLVGFALVPYVRNAWYRFQISDLGTSINVKIYNVTAGNNSLISEQTLSDSNTFTDINPDFAVGGSGGGAQGGLDNVIISTVLSGESSGINFILNEYTRGDIVTFTWAINQTDWDSLNRYAIRLFKNGEPYDFGTFNLFCFCSTDLGVGTQAGNYSLQADVPGIWEVQLQGGLLFLELVASDETRIRDYSSSYFTISPTANIKTNVTATFHVGKGGITTGIEWFFLNNGIEEREAGKFLGTARDGTVNLTFSKVGTYNVYLRALTGSAETFQMHTVVTSFVAGEKSLNNFPYNNIKLQPVNGTGGSNQQYSMNNVLYGNYSINGTIFSQEGVFYIDVFNNDSKSQTAVFYSDFGGSIGTLDNGIFAYLISSNANQPNGALNQFLPGNNSIRLRVQYPNMSSGTLAMDNFTINRTNAAGYGLDVSPLTTTVNTQVSAIVTVPNALSRLEITGTNNFLKSYNLSAGTSVITYSFKDAGIYGYTLLDATGSVQMTTQVKILASTTPAPTVTPFDASKVNADISGIMSNMAFWALIFIVVIMIAVSRRERKQ